MSSVSITLNADGTITIKVGRYQEHVSSDKGPVELLDAVRWACITGGVTPDEASLWQQIQDLKYH